MKRLQDKVALIAGAGTGISEAVAKKFAAKGAKVLFASPPGDPAEDVVNSINEYDGKPIEFAGDLADDSQAQDCLQKVIGECGQLDVLVNTAGVYQEMNPTEDFSIEGFDHMIRNSIRSAFLMKKYALPHIQKTRGNVLFTGSEAGTIGQPN
jgi:NAD(P)-dependent dehydrogenase (short-subunit alcohol dehydrogenase family)